MKLIDIAGQRFGRLTVLHMARSQSLSRRWVWACVCDCGNTARVSGSNLRDGTTLSCGCFNRDKQGQDLTGLRFSHLVAVRLNGHAADGKFNWLCQCDCGNFVTVRSSALRSGNTKSCGCARGAAHIIHGRCGSPEYTSWLCMKARCEYLRSNRYAIYGGRGIKVCERWQSFENFYADMGERPAGHTLDRFPNNNGHYEPGNCRWATPSQQALNRRPFVGRRKSVMSIQEAA
jgi:hypothetical protein